MTTDTQSASPSESLRASREVASPAADAQRSFDEPPRRFVRIQLEDNTHQESSGDPQEQSTWGHNPLDRGRRKVRNTLRRPFAQTQKHTNPNDIHLDVLYENQRGMYLFGKPMYSGKALFPKEAAPWADERYKRTLVNITNAQVPDPSWEWAWKVWYVDMSRDVDEEGWEYSLYFNGFSWHATSPWFHSFVRRRRWIRLRKRIKEETFDETTVDDIDGPADPGVEEPPG